MVPSQTSQSQFWVPSACRLLAPLLGLRRLHSGMIIPGFSPSFFSLFIPYLHFPLPPFLPSASRAGYWVNSLLLLSFCFFFPLLRGFPFAEMIQHHTCHLWQIGFLVLKGNKILIIHLRAPSPVRSQTWAGLQVFLAHQHKVVKGQGRPRFWASQASELIPSLRSGNPHTCPVCLTDAHEMHMNNSLKHFFFSELSDLQITKVRHSEVKRLLPPTLFQPNVFRNKNEQLRDIIVLLSGQESLFST